MNTAVQFAIPLNPTQNASASTAKPTTATLRHRLGVKCLLPFIRNEQWLLSGGRDGQLLAHKIPPTARQRHANNILTISDRNDDSISSSNNSSSRTSTHLIDAQLDWINDLALINDGQHCKLPSLLGAYKLNV